MIHTESCIFMYTHLSGGQVKRSTLCYVTTTQSTRLFIIVSPFNGNTGLACSKAQMRKDAKLKHVSLFMLLESFSNTKSPSFDAPTRLDKESVGGFRWPTEQL